MASSHPPIVRPHHSHLAGASAINDELDAETVALIANLALDDLAEVLGCHKGKGRSNSSPSDEEMAYHLQTEQYNEWLSIAEDAKLAKSIGDALVTDAAYLDALITAEEAAVEDRIAAERLSRGEALPPRKSSQARLEHPTFVMDPVFVTIPEMDVMRSNKARLDASNNGLVENGFFTMDNESMFGGSVESDIDQLVFSTGRSKQSSTVGKQPSAGPSTDHKRRVNCIVCQDSRPYFEIVDTPCGHYYCRGCLEALVEAFTHDESLFPLRCCQDPIPIAGVLPVLPLGLRDRFERKHAEFSIPSKDRLYCSSALCSTFLGSSEGRLSSAGIECPQCHVNTCAKCKELAHPGEGCGVRASNETFQALAKTQRWQTCPGCQAVVELSCGCYHITCRCNAQFCYLCAAPWKACGCPKFA